MLTILLDSRKSEPLYQQICRAIRREIAQGRLQPNEKLPSRRALSAHLQTSLMTVQTAYEQLTAEGYLYARPRAGYFVDPDAHLLFQEPDPLLLTSPIQPEPVPPKDQINFSTSGVDLEQFPFATWAKLSRQVLSTKQETLLHATPAMGLYPLRRAISAHLREFRGIHAAPEQILVGAGTEYLLGILVQLLGASRRYAVEEFQSTPSVWRETAKLHSFPLKTQQSKCNFDKKEHRYTSPCQKKYFFSDFFTKKQVRIPPAFFVRLGFAPERFLRTKAVPPHRWFPLRRYVPLSSDTDSPDSRTGGYPSRYRWHPSAAV